jgi:hypothetical protein
MTKVNRFIFNLKTTTFFIFFIMTFALTGCGESDEKNNTSEPDLAAAFQVLDKVHEAFNQKDTGAMYQHFTKATEFFGTDSSENWDLEGFKAYMAKYIASPNPGPNYKVKWRKLAPSSDSKVLWGVEELDYPSLKMPVRSTVVLENIQGKWKVQMQQWHFLIKNEKVNEVDQLH